jgi:hypothetical protein
LHRLVEDLSAVLHRCRGRSEDGARERVGFDRESRDDGRFAEEEGFEGSEDNDTLTRRVRSTSSSTETARPIRSMSVQLALCIGMRGGLPMNVLLRSLRNSDLDDSSHVGCEKRRIRVSSPPK